MFQRKEVLSIGICALALALILRMVGSAGVLPLQNGDMLSFLVYLQTGRVVRYPTAPAPEVPQPTSPAPTQPAPQRPSGLILTDAGAVRLSDLVDYQPDIESLLLSPLDWDLTGEQPTVLILHTHATESYTKQPGQIYDEDSSYRTFNASYNMLSIGEELKRVLTAGGISVLHDRTLHDYPSFNGSYDHARQTIRAYLQAYPSIKMVIDLHRDALDFEQDPQLTTLATVGGQKSAQLMLVAGTDHNVSYSHWEENLALGVKLTAVLEKMYPGITRPIQLRPQRFNLDMSPGSILVEVGANGDTHEEALIATRALGAAILTMAQGVNLQHAPPL
jgi:stage II sporulation protein P